jgi:hypothetical protein
LGIVLITVGMPPLSAYPLYRQAQTAPATSPLHEAAAAGRAGRVQALLARGANVNARNARGESPLTLAVRGMLSATAESEEGFARTIQLLKANGGLELEGDGSAAVVAPAAVVRAAVPPGAGYAPPSRFSKGHVFEVAPDGLSARGRCVTEAGTEPWEWTAAGGFTFGGPIKGDWTEHPGAPAQRLAAWGKTHGWHSQYPGKPLGSRKAFWVAAASISQDGSVVVGNYGCLNTAGKDAGQYQFQDIGGKQRNVSIRSFVWTKGRGFRDLWDLAGASESVEPKEETYNISTAVSRDGKTIAFLTEKLYVVRLAEDSPPRAARSPLVRIAPLLEVESPNLLFTGPVFGKVTSSDGAHNFFSVKGFRKVWNIPSDSGTLAVCLQFRDPVRSVREALELVGLPSPSLTPAPFEVPGEVFVSGWKGGQPDWVASWNQRTQTLGFMKRKWVSYLQDEGMFPLK